jgi:hypothetical protein
MISHPHKTFLATVPIITSAMADGLTLPIAWRSIQLQPVSPAQHRPPAQARRQPERQARRTAKAATRRADSQWKSARASAQSSRFAS